MLWKQNIEVQIQSFTNRHISVTTRDLLIGRDWLITSFYGYPDASKRSSTWSLLKILNPNKWLPWFYFGDFNKITYQDEK